jgi:hypothetical protein
MENLPARHATRKLTTKALTCRRKSKDATLKRAGETLKGAKRQGLTVRPMESEQPGAEINYLQKETSNTTKKGHLISEASFF